MMMRGLGLPQMVKTYEFTDDDGTVYKWDKKLRPWVPQETVAGSDPYDVDHMTFQQKEELFPTVGVDGVPVKKEDTITNTSDVIVEKDTDNANGKRKMPENPVEKQEPNQPPDSRFELKVNTHVYVTGLPDDVIFDEFVEVFSKCGIIKEDPEAKKPRVKIYVELSTKKLERKREPSDALALQILDGSPLRLGDKIPMSVTPTKFEQKGEKFIEKQVDKRKKKKLQKVEHKMLGWGGRDDSKLLILDTVVLRYMFSPAEMRADENLNVELAADVQEECAKLGAVESVKAALTFFFLFFFNPNKY